MPKKTYNNFTGGENLNDPTNLKKSELALAQNVYYDSQDRLQPRRGILNYKNPISDAVDIVHDMNSYNGNGTWAASGDANTVATEGTNKKFESGSVSFAITVSGTSATISNTGMTHVDLSGSSIKDTGYFELWAYIPDVTNFTSVGLRLGNTLSSDDYSYTFTTDASGNALSDGWNRLKILWSSMTSTGSPTGVIEEISVTYNYTGSYTNQTGCLVDGIVWYSETYNKGVHTLFEAKLSDLSIYTIAACGENVFYLDENDFVLVKDGFTDGLPFAIVEYKDVFYLTNGNDNYSSIDFSKIAASGAITAEHASVPKGKVLMTIAQTAFLTGVKGSNKVYYTGTLPTDLQSFGNDETLIDDTGFQEIISIKPLPNDAVVVFKEKSAFYLDVITSPVTIRPVDFSEGSISDRANVRVGNELYLLATNGYNTLSQRQGAVGTFAGEPISRNMQPYIEALQNPRVANAFYYEKYNHIYLNIDTSGNGVPDVCLVRNTKLNCWTHYTNISANQMIEHENSDGTTQLIYANGYSGQIREFEKGFNDNGVEIVVKVYTGELDMGNPTAYKELREADISGYISENEDLDVINYIDAEESGASSIEGDNFEFINAPITLNETPLAENPLTGESQSENSLPLAIMNVRDNVYQTGYRFQIRFESFAKDSTFILQKLQFYYDELPFDFFATDSYI